MPVPLNVYFFGEFGMLNSHVVGAVERYLRSHPQASFTIATYPDYHAILNLLFPGRFVLLPRSHYFRHVDWGRFGSIGTGVDDVMKRRGFRNLFDVTWPRQETSLRMQRSPRTHQPYWPLVPLTTPLRYASGYVKLPPGKAIVSFCCRRRAHGAYRNLRRLQWNTIFKRMRTLYPDDLFVLHGLPQETYTFTDLPAETAATVLKSIHYLNRSRCLITSMSGFAQFAANCQCHTIQVGSPERFFVYSPFGTLSARMPPSEIPNAADFIRKILTRDAE